MPFDLDEVCREFCRNSTVKRVFSNPLIVALIITILICILTYFLFYDLDEEEDYGLLKRVARAGVYNLAIITTMTLIHYKVVEEEFGKATRNETRDEVMRVVNQTDALTPERLNRIDQTKAVEE